MSGEDSEDVATDPLTIYIQDTLRSWQSVSCLLQSEPRIAMCCAAEVSRTCAMCAIVGCCDAHLDPDPAPLLLLITEPALHPDLCSRNVHI